MAVYPLQGHSWPYNGNKAMFREVISSTGFIFLFRVFKMRLAVSAHHTNPRSPTLVGWKNSMPIEEYRVVRNQKRKQKNIPDS